MDELDLRRLLDALPDALVVTDVAGRHLLANAAAERLGLGATDAALLDGDGITPFPPGASPFARALAGEEVDDAPLVIRSAAVPAGVPVGVSARPWRDPEGRIRGAVAVFRDARTRRAHEEELRRARVFLDSIVENIPDMIFVKDAEHLRFERFNRAGEQLLGLTREQLIGKSDRDFFPAEQADFFTRRDRETLEKKQLVDVPEEPIDTARGRRWLHTKKIPVLDEHGTPRYLLGISADITARKQAEDARTQAEEALRRAHAELEQRVLERTVELVRANADLRAQASRLQLVNHIARAIAGRHDLYSVFHVVLQYLEQQLPADLGVFYACEPAPPLLRVAALGPRSRARGSGALHEGARISPEDAGVEACLRGEPVYVPDLGHEPAGRVPASLAALGTCSFVAVPLKVEASTLGILVAKRRRIDGFSVEERAFLRAVAEHVALAANQARLHGELQKAYDDLRRTQDQVVQQERLRALGQMASGIAHDFNNALGPVIGFSDLLLSSPEDRRDDASLRHHLRLVNTAARDAARVVSRMKDFYRHRDPDEPHDPLDLNRVVEDSVSLTRPRWKQQAQASGVEIQVDLELGALPVAFGNAADLREALTNLILNAADAMPAGGRIVLRTRAQNGHVVVEVADTGTGMSDDVRRRCFEPFFTTKGRSGTGLGLAMVHGVIRRHGGEVEVDTAPGQGTTFRLRLPVFVPRPAADRAPGPEPVSRPLRVLVVEDQPAMRELIVSHLAREGHAVVVARDGGEALGKLDGGRFDVVVTDRAMPEVSGDHVALAVKSRDATTPVILLTGFGEFMNASGEKPEGVELVLAKPIDMARLSEAIARLVAVRP